MELRWRFNIFSLLCVRAGRSHWYESPVSFPIIAVGQIARMSRTAYLSAYTASTYARPCDCGGVYLRPPAQSRADGGNALRLFWSNGYYVSRFKREPEIVRPRREVDGVRPHTEWRNE